MKRSVTLGLLVTALLASGALAAAAFGGFGDWGAAVDIESYGAGAHANFNTTGSTPGIMDSEGCPFISPDGKMFFIASNRPGGKGGLDIWVSTRASEDEPWGEPVNLDAPINTVSNDFCPTIARDGKTFFFASNRPGYCGTTQNADIYTTRFGPGLQAGEVIHLGCVVNSAWDEHSPFPAQMPGVGPVLFYSSARPANDNDAPGDHDLYMSPMHGGVYQAGVALTEVNTEKNEGQPNVRRDGQELFFWSDRLGGQGMADIYSAEKLSVTGEWGTPHNLGPGVNSDKAETRPSLSWDGTTLYFGSTRTGNQDIYVTSR